MKCWQWHRLWVLLVLVLTGPAWTLSPEAAKEALAKRGIVEKEAGLFEHTKEGSLEWVTLIMDASLPVNAVDNDGWTPLHVAAWDGQDAVMRLLLERGSR